MTKKLFSLQLKLFIILLILWNLFTPVLEGADEVAHFCEADYIAHQNRLPNLKNRDYCFLDYQPLYYLTLVPIIKLFNLPQMADAGLKINPNFSQLRRGEYSQYIHGKEELLFKWDKFKIMIHVLRFISSIYAILIFLLAWRMSRYVFRNEIQRNLSLLLFFNPMFLHIFSTLTNVTLISAVASALICIDIVFAKKKKPLKWTFVQGILLGLALVTKISSFMIIIAFLGVYFYRWKNLREKISLKTREIIIVIGGILSVSGWYILRSLNLYGEVLEINVARPYRGEHHWLLLKDVGFLNYLNSFILTLFRTFWSGYGALTVKFPKIIDTVLLIIVLLIISSVLVLRKKINEYLKICICYFFLIVLGLMIINFRTAAMHAKDLFVAYIPIAFLFSFSLFSLKESLNKNVISKNFYLLIFFISIYFLAQVEIVLSLKSILKIQSINMDSIDPVSIFISKTLFVIVLIFLLTYIFGKIKFSYEKILVSTIAVFLLDLMILGASVYLFYFKFI